MAAGRYAEPVSLVDLLPTTLDLLDLPAAANVQGRSLLGLVRDPAGSGFRERPIFAQVGRSVAVRVGSKKWIASASGEIREYDLDSDPDELSPAGADDIGRAWVDRYAQEGADLLRRLGEPVPVEVEIDDETRLQLQALGYSEVLSTDQ